MTVWVTRHLNDTSPLPLREYRWNTHTLGIEGAHHSSDVTTDTAVSVRWTVTKLHVTISANYN